MTDRRPCHSDITSSVRTQHPCAGTLRNARCSVNSIGYRESEYRESTFHTLYGGLRVIRLADAARSSSTDARRSAVSDAAARGWALMKSGRARGGTARWLPPTMMSGGPVRRRIRCQRDRQRTHRACRERHQECGRNDTRPPDRRGRGCRSILGSGSLGSWQRGNPCPGCRQRQGGQVVIRRPAPDHRTSDQSAGSSILRMGLLSVRVRRGGATA